MARQQRSPPDLFESLQEYGRGIGGGFLFSMPMLYTLEVWSAGSTVTPARLLAGLGGTFLLLCAYNAYAGLRYDSGLAEIMVDSVEELGIGLALGALMLLILGAIGPGISMAEALGKIVVEGMFVAIGVSVGTAQLGARDWGGAPQGRQQSVVSEIALALCGAVLIAANVGPTEEVLQIGSAMELWRLSAMMGVSMALAVTLMYFSDFVGSGRFAQTSGLMGIVEGGIVTYATALVGSAGILWFFARFQNEALAVGAAQCVVLALPATLGASAGRLLLR